MRADKKVILIPAALFLLAAVLITELTFISLYRDWDNPEFFRNMQIEQQVMSKLTDQYEFGSPAFFDALTKGMLDYRFQLTDGSAHYPAGSLRYRLTMKPVWDRYRNWYPVILSDIRCFPVEADRSGNETYELHNSWMGARSYGGKRFHEGTDIMADNNQRGYFHIISMTNGVVEKMGWLEKGGYRIGIRSPSGAYFYYAHLYSYEEGLREGDTVRAGQRIGTMGDSGYGKEGTVGQFDVHLHMGIYFDVNDRETSINPYYILQYLNMGNGEY